MPPPPAKRSALSASEVWGRIEVGGVRPRAPDFWMLPPLLGRLEFAGEMEGQIRPRGNSASVRFPSRRLSVRERGAGVRDAVTYWRDRHSTGLSTRLANVVRCHV